MVQIGEHRYYPDYLKLQLWLPNGSNVSGALAILSTILAIGAAHLLAAAAVLSMTAWKFSGLVGRAPQRRKLAAEDRRDMAERAVVSAGL